MSITPPKWQWGWLYDDGGTGPLLLIPLSLSEIVLLITGISTIETVPIPLTALVAYFIVNGILGLGGEPAESK